MAWVVLIVSGILEAVWATALGKSEGFTRLWPSLVFFGALPLSMGGLAWAMRDISTGTAYAVWVGIGAALTVAWAMITGDTDVSWVKLAAHGRPRRLRGGPEARRRQPLGAPRPARPRITIDGCRIPVLPASHAVRHPLIAAASMKCQELLTLCQKRFTLGM